MEPYQMYCQSCLGPMQHDDDGSFQCHGLKDCVEWLARRHLFTEPVVFPGCRPRPLRSQEAG